MPEIFGQYGLADAVYEKGTSLELMERIVFMTSLGGDGPLDRRLIGTLDGYGGGALRERYEADSAVRATNLPLNMLEPLLQMEAERQPVGARGAEWALDGFRMRRLIEAATRQPPAACLARGRWTAREHGRSGTTRSAGIARRGWGMAGGRDEGIASARHWHRSRRGRRRRLGFLSRLGGQVGGVAAVGDEGAVLVRPDAHVAWCCQSRPADPAMALDAAVCATLGLGLAR
jgi:hypothetical protein